MATNELIVRIGANADQFRGELDKVSKTTKNLEKQLATVAKISGAAFTAGALAIGGATAAANKFESKFTDVVTLLDKSSFSTMNLDQGISSLRKGVLQLGQESGESFDDLNKSLFDLISSGVPAEEAIDTLRITTELAAAGATDTSTAVRALTATLTAFGDSAGTAGEISEKFFTAQKFGVTTVGELASEFSKVAGTANSLGISFDETLASLSALTADGAKETNVAATQLRASFTSIINIQKSLGQESEQVQDALDLQNVKQRGLVKSLELLKEATGGNIPEMQRLLGSAESLSVALSLTGAQSELVKRQVKEMGDEQRRAAVFADALAIKQENGSRALERFNRVVETGAIVIGEQFAPILTKAADLLGGFFKVLVNNPVLAKTTALVLGLGTAFAGIATFGSVAALAFLKIKAAMIALNVTTRVLALGIKGLVGATGIGLLLIIANEVFNNWATIWPAVVKIFSATVDAISNLGAGLGKILKGIFTLDSDAISEGMDQARDAITKGLGDIANAVKGEKPKVEIDLEAKANDEQIKNEVERAKEVGKDSGDIVQSVSTSQSASRDTASDDSVEKLREKEKEKTDILTEEQRKRVEQNKNAIDLIEKQNQGASDKELDLIRRKNDLSIAEEQAKNEKNQAVRESELELIEAQREQLLEEERIFLEEKRLIQAEDRETQAALEEELKLLSDAQKAELNEQELAQLQQQLMSRREATDAFAKEQLQFEIKRRNQYLKDEQQFGKTSAELNKFLSSREVQFAKESANELIQLSQSKNKSLASIGKAASVTQIAIDTASGAASIFAKLNALFPILAPGIGIAGASAITAFGAEKTAAVLAANTGGLVPRDLGVPGKDSVSALLTPGELVVPEKNFDEVINSVSASRNGASPLSGENASPAMVALLSAISTKLDKLETPITINGDVLDSEPFVDELIEKIRDARDFRNATLEEL